MAIQEKKQDPSLHMGPISVHLTCGRESAPFLWIVCFPSQDAFRILEVGLVQCYMG